LGATKFLILVEAITRLSDTAVHVNQTGQRLAGAPPYDPDLIHEDVAEGAYAGEGYYSDLYTYYGYLPYWSPRYVTPPYPYYRNPI
jgi:hypothetical protein